MYVCDVHTTIFTKLVLKYKIYSFRFFYYYTPFPGLRYTFLTMLSGFEYFLAEWTYTHGTIDAFRKDKRVYRETPSSLHPTPQPPFPSPGAALITK